MNGSEETRARLGVAANKTEMILHDLVELQKLITRRPTLELTSAQRGAYMSLQIQLAEAERALRAALSNLKFAHRESPR